MRGDAAVFLIVLGLFVAMEAAFAQGSDPRCKDPYEACSVDLSRKCLLRMGAGSEALSGDAPDECAAQMTGYRSCLAEIAERCAPEPSAADDRSPREKLTALGREFSVDDYIAAANDEDWPALDLYHQAGFLKSAKRACQVIDFVFRGRLTGSTERIAAALPAEATAGTGCKGYVVQNRVKPSSADRLNIESFRPGPVYLLTSACLYGDLKLNRKCGGNDLSRRLVRKEDLSRVVAPRFEALDLTEQALLDAKRRLDICIALMGGPKPKDPNKYDLSVLLGFSGSVFGDTRQYLSFGWRNNLTGRYHRQYCEKTATEAKYRRAVDNVTRARERLQKFVAFGG